LPQISPDRSLTERALLDAAAVLLERGGPKAVTTRAVLAEAGVTAPTLYHHFGDKDGLLDALIEEGVARFFAQHAAALKATTRPLEDLRLGWAWYLDFVCQQPQLFRLLSARALEDPKLLDDAMAWTRARLEQLEAAGQLNEDAAFGVQTLMSISLGVAALRAQGASEADFRRVANLLFERNLSALIRPRQGDRAAL
jgi:AcrR family transcriptional regulator